MKKLRAVHAMSSLQARRKKLKGHRHERDFNSAFGNSEAKLNYSGPSSDCVILDENFFRLLKEKLGIKGNNVSLKSGNTIQIHLGSLPELTDILIWNKNLGQNKMKSGQICTTSIHGMPFKKQKLILKDYHFWKKYLGKGEVLCYRADKNKWLFFEMDNVLNFIAKNFDWRLLETGRLKGDYKGKQYLTYEYRSESHKKCFVLGAHGGKKGKEFIELLMKNIPFVEEIR